MSAREFLDNLRPPQPQKLEEIRCTMRAALVLQRVGREGKKEMRETKAELVKRHRDNTKGGE